jgi:opacity protein-like surface antigen
VELAWGASADGLGLPGALSIDDESGALASGDLPHLYQAYVNYLAPIGPGLEVGMGRFSTFVGAESFRADENWTITRGLVWAIQPVNHTGIWTGMEWENGFFFKLAAVNGYSNTMKDFDNDKGFLGSAGWNGEMFGVKLNGFYGGDVTQHAIFGAGGAAAPFVSSSGTQRDSISLIDTVISFTPSDRFQAWLNFDWYRSDGSDQAQVNQMDIYALALAGRFGITERLGLSMRYEMLYIEDHPLLLTGVGPIFAPGPLGQGRDATLMSFTTGLDYALTDNLTVRAEGRYDWGNTDDGPDAFFVAAETAPINGNYFTRTDQFLGIVQMLYSF